MHTLPVLVPVFCPSAPLWLRVPATGGRRQLAKHSPRFPRAGAPADAGPARHRVWGASGKEVGSGPRLEPSGVMETKSLPGLDAPPDSHTKDEGRWGRLAHTRTHTHTLTRAEHLLSRNQAGPELPLLSSCHRGYTDSPKGGKWPVPAPGLAGLLRAPRARKSKVLLSPEVVFATNY